MPARRNNAEVSLAALCETIELAQRMAGELQAEASPSYDELMEGLASAHFSALRIAVELMRSHESLER
jgi:hypothetical protein